MGESQSIKILTLKLDLNYKFVNSLGGVERFADSVNRLDVSVSLVLD